MSITFAGVDWLSLQTDTKDVIELAHSHFVGFCRQFEELYGADRCTPNMHMACHLKDCILDYGVLSAFWCFCHPGKY